ncbi:MAG TPA: hypothetical protein VFP84_19060 [Kofleriaceae bacterium]|nr:hypothetical protein [Kofleriaceae bacterium]
MTLGLGLSLAVAGTACKKDDKKADTATGDKAADKGDKAADKGGDKPGAMPKATGDDLSLIPLDSELVLGLNFAQLQSSALWKQFVEPMMLSNADMVKDMGEFKAKCGFDPLLAIKSISVGLKNIDSGKPEGVAIVHGLEKGKIATCLDAMKDQMAAKGSEVTRDGDVILVKNTKENKTVGMTFTNDTTLLVAIADPVTADTVKKAAATQSTLKTSPPFLDMYSKVKTGDSLWALMNGNSKAFDKMGQMGAKPKALFGSLNVTDGLAVDMRMRFEKADDATQVATAVKQQIGSLSKFADKAEANADGSDVHIEIGMSNQKLQSLIQQFGPMLSAFGGGGMKPAQ